MIKKLLISRFKHTTDLFGLSSDIEHSGEKGGFREYFITELIRPIIPPHFGIGTGVIIDSTGKQSPQADLLIYDKRTLPPIFCADNRGIFPIDSVIAVVEIKSLLTASELKKTEKMALSLCPNNDDYLHIITPGKLEGKEAIYPLYSIFAYASDVDKDEGVRIKEHCSALSIKGFRLIGVVNKGIWYYNDCTDSIVKEKYGNEEFIVQYLKMLLSKIEEIAKSRGDYGLKYWL